VAHPLKKSERKREEPKLGEPKLVHPDSASDIPIAQKFTGERVADTLIRARQQLGQDLRSIAEVLCIRYSYLDALERGQYENLPGPTYAVGFMRTYAEYLGLDGEQIVERFKNEVEGLDSQTKLHFPTPAPEGKMPGGAVFLVAALLFAGAYGVWFYLSNQGESLSDLVAPVPEQLQEMVGGAGSSGTTNSTGESPAAGTSSAASPAVSQEAPASAPQAAAEPAMTAPALATAPAAGDSEAAPEASAMPAPASDTPAAQSAATGATGETPAAPRMTAPHTAMPAPVADTPAAQQPAAGASTPPAGQGAVVLHQPTPAPGEAAPAETPQATTQEALLPPPAAPEAPAAPAASEPYAIPAAPESGVPATAFLLNHEPTVYGQENADARIVLKAHQDAWVQVRDREGNLLLTRVLRVGDSYMVPNQADLTLLTGNAGGLEITVDGSALPALGPVGAVRRNIPLDPDALRDGAGRQP